MRRSRLERKRSVVWGRRWNRNGFDRDDIVVRRSTVIGERRIGNRSVDVRGGGLVDRRSGVGMRNLFDDLLLFSNCIEIQELVRCDVPKCFAIFSIIVICR